MDDAPEAPAAPPPAPPVQRVRGELIDAWLRIPEGDPVTFAPTRAKELKNAKP